MPLSDVRHQAHAQHRLQQALRAGRVPHAYLFTGPAGVGKEMLATRLAATLLCDHPQEVPAPEDAIDPALPWRDACGRCTDCTLMAAGNHPDFHRIHRALNKHHPDKTIQRRKAIDLSVDVIRHFLIARVAMHPSRNRAKLFLIVEAQRMSTAAQNAMLKTLEEPPGHSHLILLATSPEALLETTRSRCHQVAFRALPTQFIVHHLTEHQGLGAGAARYLAELSQGSLGLAVRYAESGLVDRIPDILQAVRAAPGDPLGTGKALLDAAQDLTATVKTWGDEEGDTNAARVAQAIAIAMVSTLLRDVQRVAVGHTAAALRGDSTIRDLAAVAKSESIGKAIRTLSLAEYQINHSANTALVFDQVGIAIAEAVS